MVSPALLRPVAPALPGSLHPTSTTPVTFSMLALMAGYRTSEGRYKQNEATENAAVYGVR
jgi:hypothetical protein